MYEIKIWMEGNGNIVAFMRRGGRESYREISIDEVRDDICMLDMEFIHFWEFLTSNAQKTDHWKLPVWLHDRLKEWKEKNKNSRMP